MEAAISDEMRCGKLGVWVTEVESAQHTKVKCVNSKSKLPIIIRASGQ